jgi:hypothetical protein
LYAIERQAKDRALAAEERRDLRQQQALPMLATFNPSLTAPTAKSALFSGADHLGY